MTRLFSGRCHQTLHRIVLPIHDQVRRLGKRFCSRSPICSLPVELLLEVFSYLPLPSQACLALSCKGFYQLFNTVLQAPELRFPQLVPLGPKELLHTRYVLSKEYLLRMELLIQLENSRWACCAGCQKLHRREEFLPQRRLEEYPLNRLCMRATGLLDLCPCITLTIRDRKHVVGYLMGGKNLSFVDKGHLEDSCNEKGDRSLIHRCSSYATVRVEIVLSLTEGDRLIAHTRHEVPPDVLRWNMENVPCCRHYHLWRSITNIVDYGSSWRCGSCHTNVASLMDPNTSDLVLTTTRDLGKGLWPTDVDSNIGAVWSSQGRDYIHYMPMNWYQ